MGNNVVVDVGGKSEEVGLADGDRVYFKSDEPLSDECEKKVMEVFNILNKNGS